MEQAYVVTASLTDGKHLALDETIPLASGKVRVVVEPLPAERQVARDLASFERTLRERQAARGHVPPTKQEVDAYLNAERDSWDF